MLKIIIIILLVMPLVYASQICIDDPNNFCNATISIATDKNIYNNKEKITILNNLSVKGDYIIEYWVENSNGTIIKDKLNTTNLNAKSFTPNLKDSDKLKIKNRLASIDCNNTNTIIESEKEIEVYVYKSSEPFLEIINIYLGSDNSIELNESMKVKFNAYTGNFTSLLSIEIINITSQTTHLLSKEYTEFNFTDYLQIPNDCSIQTNNYTLKLEAFNKQLFHNISIINACKEENKTSIALTNSIPFESESNINLIGSTITGEAVYKSSSEKTSELSMYLLIAIGIMASMYIVPKMSKDGISNKSNNGSNRLPRRARKQSIH